MVTKDDDKRVTNETRRDQLGFPNIAILFMLLGFALFAMCGCATFESIVTDESIQELAIEQLGQVSRQVDCQAWKSFLPGDASCRGA